MKWPATGCSLTDSIEKIEIAGEIDKSAYERKPPPRLSNAEGQEGTAVKAPRGWIVD